MASSLAPPEPTSLLPDQPQDDAIDRRIRQTRRQLKLNDFATASIALLAGVLAYLLLGALADHWLVPGGLGFTSRLVLFLGLAAVGGWYCLQVLLPPLVYQVNPIYAAKTLEQARPSLKNSLINLLHLRREGVTGRDNPLAERVIEGLRESTADQLQQIPAELAVDRIHLIRRGYVLVALVALSAFYLVFSPKNPLPSFGRVHWPWARNAAPSRVQIDQVHPGNATAFQGRSVTVSAVVEGLRAGEEVLLRYSTDDGQFVDQAIPMTPGDGRSRYQCQVPPTKAGLQQSLRYHLSAGDSTSFEYRLEMQVPPTIVVDSVRYTYPQYTGLPERVVDDSADVRAIEGTQISIEATANHKIQWAGIELSETPEKRLRMQTDGKHARGQFGLQLPPADNASPRWYQIRFAEADTGENRENLDPVRHRIEVFPDLPPQVRLVDPPADYTLVPLDGLAELKVEASDPDFALARVAVLAQRDGRPLPIPLLLDQTDLGRGYQGQFRATCRIEPARLGLQVGDEIQYQAVAEDNKTPQRNRTQTDPHWLKIGPPKQSPTQSPQPTGQPGDGNPQPARQQTPADPSEDPNQAGQKDTPQPPESEPQDNAPGPPTDQGNPGGQSQQQQPGDQGQEGAAQQPNQPGKNGAGADGQNSQDQGTESQKNEQPGQGDPKAEPEGDPQGQEGDQPGQQGPKTEKPVDPEAPGDVFEEVLKQREKDAQQGNQQPQPGGQSQPQNGEQSQPQPADQSQTPQGQPSPNPKPGDQPQGDQPGAQPQPKPDADSPSGQGQSSGTPQPGEKSDDAQQSESPSNVPPNRTEQGDQGGQNAPPDSSQAMKGTGGQPAPTPPGQAQQTPPETESGASGGNPTGQPGKKEPPKDPQTIDGGKATPEDLKNGQVESVERRPHDPASGNTPEQSANPQPGSPKPGDTLGGQPAAKPPEAQPSPMPQESNQPNAEKPTGDTPAGDQKKPEAMSPSISKKQSDQDQREPTDGDRSGNGGKGGGQDSDQQGLGNPGSSTPDDQGGQPGGEQGQGETGPGAGDKVPTDQPTGNQARQPGGQRQAPSPSQDQGAGQTPPQNPQTPQTRSQPPDPTDQAAGGSPGTDPTQRGAADPDKGQAAGGSGPTSSPGQGSAQTPSGPEAANKEFAEKATDLALEYIEDQLNKTEPNPELLDRLGWTRQDLEQFLRRWQKMKADAQDTGPAGQEARHELDEALKSLGLRPARSSIQGGQVKDDTLTNTESVRSNPPPAWRELTQEYTRSISSGSQPPAPAPK
ncbi:MAG: hypothetical protein ACYC6Y_23155 [Thermoguttaceae bacterium]